VVEALSGGVPGPVLMRNFSSKIRDPVERRDTMYTKRASFRGISRQVMGLAVKECATRRYKARVLSNMDSTADRRLVSVVTD